MQPKKILSLEERKKKRKTDAKRRERSAKAAGTPLDYTETIRAKSTKKRGVPMDQLARLFGASSKRTDAEDDSATPPAADGAANDSETSRAGTSSEE